MVDRLSRTVTGSESLPLVPKWDRLETGAASAFTLSGVLIAASAVAPVGLAAITDWAWVSGIALVGVAVLAAAAGLLGVYPRVVDRTPWLAKGGALAAGIAGGGAVGLLALAGTALLAEGALGMQLAAPKRLFMGVLYTMTSGFSLGFLLFGIALGRAEGRSSRVGRLLFAGGALLMVPIAGELLRVLYGIGNPHWVLFVALGLVSVDTLAVGLELRTV